MKFLTYDMSSASLDLPYQQLNKAQFLCLEETHESTTKLGDYLHESTLLRPFIANVPYRYVHLDFIDVVEGKILKATKDKLDDSTYADVLANVTSTLTEMGLPPLDVVMTDSLGNKIRRYIHMVVFEYGHIQIANLYLFVGTDDRFEKEYEEGEFLEVSTICQPIYSGVFVKGLPNESVTDAILDELTDLMLQGTKEEESKQKQMEIEMEAQKRRTSFKLV